MENKTIHEDLKCILELNIQLLKPFEASIITELTMLQFRTLCIIKNRGSITLRELCAAQKITKQQQSLILQQLEKLGYITRNIDPNDRRIVIFQVTTKAILFLSKHLSLIIDTIIERVQYLDQDSKDELYNAIHVISKTLGKLI